MSKRRFTNKMKTSGMLFLAILMLITTCIPPHHTYAVSQPSVVYSAHMQSYGWLNEVKNGATGGVTGEAKQMEALKIRLDNAPYKGNVTYSAHVASVGWQNWKKNNQMAGTTGESRKIEALRIKLTDEMAAHYDIVYRAHVSRIGWQDWVKNGSIAGTTGQNLAIEAIEIKLVPKTSRGVTTTPKNVDVITVSENDTSYTKGNNLVIFKEPDVRNFNVTTNAGNRANIYKKSRTSPVHGTYLSPFIMYDYKDKKYRGASGTGFQSEYGSTAVAIYNAQPSDTITATWDNIGLYNNRPIDMKVVFRDFTYEKSVYDGGVDRNLVIFEISESPFSGFLIANTPYTAAEYMFYYSDTKQEVNLQGNTFLTAGSINGPKLNYPAEYVIHDSRDITVYLRPDTNLGIQSISRIPSAKGAIGLSDNFVDVLGDPTYTKNAAMFKVNGTTNRFIFGSDSGAIWASLSSAVLFNVTAPNPIKTVWQDGEDIAGGVVYGGEDITYRIEQKVHVLGQDILEKYNSMVIWDNLPKEVSFKQARLVDESGNEIRNAGSIAYNERQHRVTFTASDSFLKNVMAYNGESYFLEIDVKINDVHQGQAGRDIRFTNQATSKINGVEKESNTVMNILRNHEIAVGLKKVQIYTDKASDGLPITIHVNQRLIGENNLNEAVRNRKVRIRVTNTDTNTTVLNHEYTLTDLKNRNWTIEDVIPSEYLTRNSVNRYKVDLSVTHGRGVYLTAETIALDGYTAKEERLIPNPSTMKVDFTGVSMTEREYGRDMQKHTERIQISYLSKQQVKSGYGFKLNVDIDYKNEVPTAKLNELGIRPVVGITAKVDRELLDMTPAYLNRHTRNGQVSFALNYVTDRGLTSYSAPKMYLEQETGYMYTEQQKNSGELQGEAIHAGRKLYVPVWIDELRSYDVSFISDNKLGSHHMTFDLPAVVDVVAYMFNHINSDTPDTDELLIYPMRQKDVPDDLNIY